MCEEVHQHISLCATPEPFAFTENRNLRKIEKNLSRNQIASNPDETLHSNPPLVYKPNAKPAHRKPPRGSGYTGWFDYQKIEINS